MMTTEWDIESVDLSDAVERAMLADVLEESGRDTEAAILRNEDALPVLVTSEYRPWYGVLSEIAIGTIRDGIADAESVRQAASGAWDSCDWEADFEDEAEEAEYYRQVEEAAAEAEDAAENAVEFLRNGDYAEARNHADQASGLERQYGDDPTWGKFARLVAEIVRQAS